MFGIRTLMLTSSRDIDAWLEEEEEEEEEIFPLSIASSMSFHSLRILLWSSSSQGILLLSHSDCSSASRRTIRACGNSERCLARRAYNGRSLEINTSNRSCAKRRTTSNAASSLEESYVSRMRALKPSKLESLSILFVSAWASKTLL